MKRFAWTLVLMGSWVLSDESLANVASPVSIEIVGADGQVFREFPVSARDGALRSYLQAEKGARYQVRVRNNSGQRLGLVIAVDGRNIINGGKSDLQRTEPMYVLAPYETQDYAGWRANLAAINEFYFTDWSDSYAEAFGDASARGVIAVAVYGEVAPPRSLYSRTPTMNAAPARQALPAAQENQRAATKRRARVMATGASTTPCRSNSSRNPMRIAATSSNMSGARHCAASTCSSAATRTGSGMNPR